MIDGILCSCEDSLQCGFLHVLSDAVLRKKLTIHTFERFLSRMYSHMHFQIWFVYKSSITLGRAIRLFSAVGPCMYFQIMFHWKCITTFHTFKRLLSCMGSHMHYQITSIKCAATFRACICLFDCVCLYEMPFQMFSASSEGFSHSSHL